MKKSIRRAESFLHIILGFIILITLSFVVAMIILEDSITDRMYDFVILLTGSGAFVLGILASVDSRIQKHETQRIQQEIRAAVKELREIDKENDTILRNIRESKRLDRLVLKEVEEVEKLEDEEIKAINGKNQSLQRGEHGAFS